MYELRRPVLSVRRQIRRDVQRLPAPQPHPEWNDEIFSGNWKQALSRLRKTNNFPEFTGRVCPALCEAACTCGMNGKPVTVHENELAIVEEGYKNGWIKPHILEVRSGKRVAIVGSGPSGLAAADQLNQRGHDVTVFERDKKPGGLLRYGIPNMKLEKRFIDRRVAIMEAEGVKFRCGINVVPGNCETENSIGAAKLEKDFDAVIICAGAKTGTRSHRRRTRRPTESSSPLTSSRTPQDGSPVKKSTARRPPKGKT